MILNVQDGRLVNKKSEEQIAQAGAAVLNILCIWAWYTKQWL